MTSVPVERPVDITAPEAGAAILAVTSRALLEAVSMPTDPVEQLNVRARTPGGRAPSASVRYRRLAVTQGHGAREGLWTSPS